MKLPARNDLTASFVKSVLDYNPETGVFVWKTRADVTKQVNGRFSGKIAGCRMLNGYMSIGINGRLYLSHRLAWLVSHGEWPPSAVDHINGDRGDNRLANLRMAGNSENGANMKLRSNSTSGFKGVSTRSAAKPRWRAQIMKSGQYISLGGFSSKHEAHEAYCEMARKLFGDFARSK